MSSQTTCTVIEDLIRHKPGITSEQLWNKSRLVFHKLTVRDFENCLWDLREKGYLVTNKQWYPKGHVAEPKRHGPKKEDPRQTRMFG